MAENPHPKPKSGDERSQASPTPRHALEEAVSPVSTRTLYDEVVQDLAPPAGVSPASQSSSASLRAAGEPVNTTEAEQSERSNTAVHHPNIPITGPNTPQVAQNAGVSQRESHDDPIRERERTASRSPISPSSFTTGDGNETDETEYFDEGVGLDGTDEGVDIDLLLQRVADDEARKRNEGE